MPRISFVIAILSTFPLGCLGTSDVSSIQSSLTASDQDLDGIEDSRDNCVDIPNPSQVDTNADGFGNACGPDGNDDGVVGLPDFSLLADCYGSSFEPGEACETFDMNADGVVGLPDYSAFISAYGKPMGPSGLSCAGQADCAATEHLSARGRFLIGDDGVSGAEVALLFYLKVDGHLYGPFSQTTTTNWAGFYSLSVLDVVPDNLELTPGGAVPIDYSSLAGGSPEYGARPFVEYNFYPPSYITVAAVRVRYLTFEETVVYEEDGAYVHNISLPFVDGDGDLVIDIVDNCPNTPNASQLDFDGDGEGDACDALNQTRVSLGNYLDDCSLEFVELDYWGDEVHDLTCPTKPTVRCTRVGVPGARYVHYCEDYSYAYPGGRTVQTSSVRCYENFTGDHGECSATENLLP